ncbi:hypothetical protein LPC10_25425 (plasmid) [Methylorubrum sp. B1-46]|uniref:hypothetical protein n=1 Tax=Methylorubrum sp. B1-46 TaxID=2897334 RepID=UPI001E354013|nr:hypothetical protein [Methylorubrum sp. B1-46]UGB28684.1 hypothetical protein LPC10_25425 [Methylorubrum sp. B1-46]
MAVLPALADALSPFDGRTPPALTVVARHLRDAGLFSVGNRGRGAAHVTAEDVAALLLASLWTDGPTASPRAVEVLATLKRRPAVEDKTLPRCLGLVIRLPNFGETVAALIEFAWIIRDEIPGLRLELTVHRPCPTASLALVDSLDRRRVIAEWQVDADRLTKGFYLPESRQRADRRHSTTITSETLFALGNLILRKSEVEA